MKKLSLILCAILSLGVNTYAVKPKTQEPRIERGIPVDSEHNRLLLQKYVVLPPGFEGQPVIVENSPEYKALVERNKSLSAQLEEEKKVTEAYKGSVDKVLIEKDKINKEMQQKLAKVEAEKKKGFIWTVIGWILGSLTFLIPIFVIVLCILNPALIPMVINFFVSVVHIIVQFFSRLFTGLKATADKIATYKKPNEQTTKPNTQRRIPRRK